MALTITKLKMWKDPGYTRNCADIPPAGSKKLPTPDYSSAADETLRPHKGSTLTSLELPLSYTECFDMSYLYIEASDGKGSISLFGWITSITQIASSNEAIRITWDCDWWRSYSSNAQLDTGVIVKCPNGTYKRPYRTQPRYWQLKRCYDVVHDRITPSRILDSLWVYVFVVWNKIQSGVTTEVITQSKIFFAPVMSQFKFDSSSTAVTGFPLDKLYIGYLDEWVNQVASDSGNSAKIIGAWIAPVPPANFTYDDNTRIWIGDGSGYTVLGTGTATDPHMMTGYETFTLDTSFTTATIIMNPCDDTNRVAMTDFNGNILGYAPYGLTPRGCTGSLDIGPNGGYMYVVFKFAEETDGIPYGGTNNPRKNHAAPAIGCGFTIPLPSVPVNENQWSDYMYAGQRDFDITNARIANEKQAISGLENAVSSGIGGGVMGASAGPIGAVSGLIGGGLISGIMTGVNYQLGENFNRQLQDATDRAYANQKNGIALPGGSKFKLLQDRTYCPMILELKPDDVSLAEYTTDIAVNGYDTDISTLDVSTFIANTTGPYRIINMTVTGNIPPQAKQYIKDKFASGVRIIENNPTGVVP